MGAEDLQFITATTTYLMVGGFGPDECGPNQSGSEAFVVEKTVFMKAIRLQLCDVPYAYQ